MSRALASISNLEIKPAGRATLVLSGRTVEVAMKPGHCREFIDRVFSVPGVAALELNLDACGARVHFEPDAGPVSGRLKGLAKAMRAAEPARAGLADLELIRAVSRDKPIEIRRAGERLTFLRIQHIRPERYRFSHPAFADATIRSAILLELLSVAYLSERIDSGWRGGFIEVAFEPGRMTLESLIDAVETALLRTVGSGPQYRLQPMAFRRRLVDTNLALAILSDYLFPPAQWLSVFTLWLLNARHFRPTWRALREGRVDLDVLYSTIAFLTLLSLSFLPSALMYWMFEFWPRRVNRLREAETAKLLARLKRRPRSVWVDREGTEMEVDVPHLQLGDTVILREGDVAPGDGLALAGDALMAEPWTAGLHRKTAGERIHCSGQIARGETRMRLDTLGEGAVTARLAAWHGQAMAQRASHDRAKRLANSTVVPVLGLALLAVWRGGISMGKAVIRPDYVNGPVIARELGWLAAAIDAAQNGLLIRNDVALEKLAQCDCFIFSPGVSWRPGERPAGEIGEALRALGVEEILTPAGTMDGSRSLVLHHAGMNGGFGNANAMDTGALIKERQYLGRQVAFFGDCIAYAGAASQADVSIHVCHPPFNEEPPGEIAVLEPALEAVLALRAIAAEYNARLKDSVAAALIPNVACVLAAFSFGFPVLGVFALTNAGTLASYLGNASAVRAAGSSGGG
jgi:hypothetical protein